MYKQVTLKKNNTIHTAWIPEHLAHIGKTLKIKDEDGWIVVDVSQIRMSKEYIEEHERDYKIQRKASDI